MNYKNTILTGILTGASILALGQNADYKQVKNKNYDSQQNITLSNPLKRDSIHSAEGIEAMINIDLNNDGKLDLIMVKKDKLVQMLRDSTGVLKEINIDKDAKMNLDLNNDGIAQDITTKYGGKEFKLIKRNDQPEGVYNQYKLLDSASVRRPRYQH